MSPIVAVAWALLAFFSLWAGQVFLALRRLRFERPSCQSCAEDEVAFRVRARLRLAVDKLKRLGFVPVGYTVTCSNADSPTLPVFSEVLYREDPPTFASIWLSSWSRGRGRPRVDFSSLRADGGLWVTASMPAGLVGGKSSKSPKSYVQIDGSQLSIGRRWARHDFDVHDLDLVAADVGQLNVEAEQAVAVVLQEGLDSGRLIAIGKAQVRLSLRVALTETLTSFIGTRASPLYGETPADSVPEGVDAEWEADRHAEWVALGRKATGLGAVVLSGLTLLLFAWPLSTLLSLDLVAALVVVVVAHELGHFFAMRHFRFREPSIFFMPFLGGATTGDKPDARLHERVLVALAGPIPGLVAALAYGLFVPLAEQSPLVRTVSLVSIFLNGFNLLPFWPLDGGHLVERTLLPGHPRLGVAFIALSASVLVGLAWVHGDWVAVVAVSVAAIFSLRSGLAVASVLRALPADGPSGQLPADCCTLVDLYRLAALVHGGDDDDRKRFSLVRRLEPRVFARTGSSRYRAAFFVVYVLVLLSAAWSIARVLNL